MDSAAGIAMGSIMAKVPQLEPTENAMAAETTNTSGSITTGGNTP
jgi:hypothetical protein